MEFAGEATPVQIGFRESEKFEINNIEFNEIVIDKNRIQASGKKWNRFELLISFIGAAWMEKWRSYGTKLLVAGIFFAGIPFFSLMIPLVGPIILAGGMAICLPLMALGVVMVVFWALVKREALMLYTPGGTLKIEGSAGLVEAVWGEVVRHQRHRDV